MNTDKLPEKVERGILKHKLEETTKFENKLGLSIRRIPLGEVVATEPSLIDVKCLDQVIRGAERVSVPLARTCRIVRMTANKQEVPLIGYTDFKVYEGKTGSSVRESGGVFDRVELNCSSYAGMRRVKVAIDKTWIRDANWSAVEEALAAAGEVMAEEMLGSVIYEYENDVDTNMTDDVANWGNDHYKALVKMASLIAAERMSMDVVLINPAELYDLMILDYFIHSNYTALAARQQLEYESGLAGYLFPNSCPIYFTPKVTAATMIGAASQKAVVLGIRQDLTVERFNDIFQGEEGAVLTAQWDAKSGADAIITKPTAKAWATATTA